MLKVVDVIERGEPACMVCHWTGIHWNGEEKGLQVFDEVVQRLHAKYDHLIWMKLSEISRYWAAKELTAITKSDTGVRFRAPYACPGFTIALDHRGPGPQSMREVRDPLRLEPGTWHSQNGRLSVCFDLEKGESELLL